MDRARSHSRVTLLESCDEESLLRAVEECDALLIRSVTRVTRAVFDRAKRLRVIGRGGAGLENIDLKAAREQGVTVLYTPSAATDAVADLTVGLMIGLLRKIAVGDALIRSGEFVEARRRCVGVELGGLTLGIIGLGRIGRAVAIRCRQGFGMTILYNDLIEPTGLDFPATPTTKDRIYQEADVVSLHVPLTTKTRRLINGRALSRFKPGAILMNTSRGEVVDNDALIGALLSGALAGAALDVFDPEPLPANHPLLTAPNTLLVPHIGARTHRGLERMNAVVDDVIGVLHGQAPRHPVSQ